MQIEIAKSENLLGHLNVLLCVTFKFLAISVKNPASRLFAKMAQKRHSTP